jgi:hypothetical protein
VHIQFSEDLVDDINQTAGGLSSLESAFAVFVLVCGVLNTIYELYLFLIFYAKERRHVVDVAHPCRGSWGWRRTSWECEARVSGTIVLKALLLTASIYCTVW